jgi:transposase
MDPRSVRLRYAVRNQVAMRCESLDSLLPPEHPVRDVWQFVCDRDLSAFLASVEALAGQAGAPAFDPRILITLWLQATLDGIGSARELADLCAQHLVYRWICGDTPINYHTLSAFRVQRAAALDGLLTQSVATLCAAGLAQLQRVSQDGMRVRAQASSKSFRRATTLQQHLRAAEAQVGALKACVAEDAGAVSRRSQAARQRAATERLERLRQAEAEMAKVQAANARRAATPKNVAQAKQPEALRVSTTDPEARKMKMGDGGYRPAFNVQFATTTVGGVIAGVRVGQVGSDYGELEPMIEQLRARYDQTPQEVLVDGGFATLETIERMTGQAITIYTPEKATTAKAEPVGEPTKKRRRPDSPAVAAWRQRMNREEGKAIYRQRASTAEWVNALARNRGLQQFLVRGLEKVQAVATWFAVAHNLQRALALKA